MIRLADFAHRHGLSYNRALDLVLRRKVAARRVGGRWFVLSSATDRPDAAPATPSGTGTASEQQHRVNT